MSEALIAALLFLPVAHVPIGATVSVAEGFQSEEEFCDAPQPLRDLPSGWLHLPEDWIDVWTGAFHDSNSGALVRYWIGGPDDRTAQLGSEGDEIERGTVGGYDYVLLKGAEARDRYERLFADMRIGPTEDAKLDPMLPAVGTHLLLTTFEVDTKSWIFESVISDSHQEDRVRALLFSRSRFWIHREPCEGPRARHAASPTSFQAQEIGTLASNVLTQLGPGDRVRWSGVDGFAVLYSLESDGRFVGHAELTFDRSQRLVSKQVEQ